MLFVRSLEVHFSVQTGEKGEGGARHYIVHTAAVTGARSSHERSFHLRRNLDDGAWKFAHNPDFQYFSTKQGSSLNEATAKEEEICKISEADLQ